MQQHIELYIQTYIEINSNIIIENLKTEKLNNLIL